MSSERAEGVEGQRGRQREQLGRRGQSTPLMRLVVATERQETPQGGSPSYCNKDGGDDDELRKKYVSMRESWKSESCAPQPGPHW